MAPVVAEESGPTWIPLYGGARAQIFQPEACFPVPGINSRPFPRSSNYSASYKPHGTETWAWCRALPIKHKECIEKTKGHVQATSTMKDDFRKHDYPERAQLILPKEEMVRGKQFESSTTYDTEFTKKRPPTPVVAPPHRMKPRVKKDIAFGTTTVQDDYQAHRDHSRPTCYKPSTDYQPCKVKFDGETTTSSAYRAWPLPTREKVKRHESSTSPLPTKGKPCTSSYKADYQCPSVYHRARASRPQREKLSLAHKNGDENPKTTQYREHFIRYQEQPCPVRPLARKSDDTPHRSRRPFQAKSVYQASYRGEPTERSKKCVPMSENAGSTKDAKMTFTSTYNDTFKGEQQQPCPTNDIINAKKGEEVNGDYRFVGSKNGHQIYRNVKDEPKADSPETTELKVSDSGDCDQAQNKVNHKVATGAAAAAKVKAEAAGQKRAAAAPGAKSAKMSRSKTTTDSKRLSTP